MEGYLTVEFDKSEAHDGDFGGMLFLETLQHKKLLATDVRARTANKTTFVYTSSPEAKTLVSVFSKKISTRLGEPWPPILSTQQEKAFFEIVTSLVQVRNKESYVEIKLQGADFADDEAEVLLALLHRLGVSEPKAHVTTDDHFCDIYYEYHDDGLHRNVIEREG